MTRRYLTAYGPATREDFGRWRGVTPAAALKLLRGLGNEVCEVDLEGGRAWALRDDLPALARAEPTGAVRLLPAFDPWVVGASRAAPQLVDGPHRDRIYRPQGWLSPVLLVDGRMDGVWRHEVRGGTRRGHDRTVRAAPPCGARRGRAGGRAPRHPPWGHARAQLGLTVPKRRSRAARVRRIPRWFCAGTFAQLQRAWAQGSAPVEGLGDARAAGHRLELPPPAVPAEVPPGDQAVGLELDHLVGHQIGHAHAHGHAEPVALLEARRPADLPLHGARAVELGVLAGVGEQMNTSAGDAATVTVRLTDRVTAGRGRSRGRRRRGPAASRSPCRPARRSRPCRRGGGRPRRGHPAGPRP